MIEIGNKSILKTDLKEFLDITNLEVTKKKSFIIF